MPWTGESFAKHNHGLSPAQASHASHIANHVLTSTGDEGESIATANKFYQHKRDAGGGMPTESGIGGSNPNLQNPMVASMFQRYAALPVDKLQQLAQTFGASPQGQVIKTILQQKQMQPQNTPGMMHATTQAPTPPPPMPMPPPAQQAATPPPAQAQAKGGATERRDIGGSMGDISAAQGTPWWTRMDARQSDQRGPALGFLHGNTAGRADEIDTTAPAGSHVIPADVVAGLGEGNSLAGAARMESVINTGPRGIPLPRAVHGKGPPRPPPLPKDAKGGGIHDDHEEPTPVLLSHGEYVVHPADVLRWGKGDRETGHKMWDAWIVQQRKKQIAKLKSLPGPVKS